MKILCPSVLLSCPKNTPPINYGTITHNLVNKNTIHIMPRGRPLKYPRIAGETDEARASRLWQLRREELRREEAKSEEKAAIQLPDTRRDELNEELAVFREHDRLRQEARRRQLGEEERVEIQIQDNARHRERLEEFSDEELAVIREHDRLRQEARRRQLGEEERVAIRQLDNLQNQERRDELSDDTLQHEERDTPRHAEVHEEPQAQNIATSSSSANIAMFKFIKHMDSYKMRTCDICLETWPSRTNHKCCVAEPFKFSPENGMYPFVDELGNPLRDQQGRLVQESIFEDVTPIEEMLIAKAFPLMRVYQLHGKGGIRFKGNVVNLPQDIQGFVNSLPNSTSALPVTLLVRRTHQKDGMIQHKDFRVRRYKIMQMLTFLKNNNPKYSDIVINLDMQWRDSPKIPI
jgi:hypothetical protein